MVKVLIHPHNLTLQFSSKEKVTRRAIVDRFPGRWLVRSKRRDERFGYVWEDLVGEEDLVPIVGNLAEIRLVGVGGGVVDGLSSAPASSSKHLQLRVPDASAIVREMRDNINWPPPNYSVGREASSSSSNKDTSADASSSRIGKRTNSSAPLARAAESSPTRPSATPSTTAAAAASLFTSSFFAQAQKALDTVKKNLEGDI